MVHHLGDGFKDKIEHHVACHHFPVGLVERDGNKSLRVQSSEDDTVVELTELPGKDGKTTRINVLLDEEEAEEFGIHQRTEKAVFFTKNKKKSAAVAAEAVPSPQL